MRPIAIEENDVSTATFRKSSKSGRTSTEFVELTWCMITDRATKSTTCYVIDESLGADVLFADEHVRE